MSTSDYVYGEITIRNLEFALVVFDLTNSFSVWKCRGISTETQISVGLWYLLSIVFLLISQSANLSFYSFDFSLVFCVYGTNRQKLRRFMDLYHKATNPWSKKDVCIPYCLCQAKIFDSYISILECRSLYHRCMVDTLLLTAIKTPSDRRCRSCVDVNLRMHPGTLILFPTLITFASSTRQSCSSVFVFGIESRGLLLSSYIICVCVFKWFYV